MKSSMLICDSKDLLIKKNVLPLFWKREKFNESGYNKNIYDLIEEKPQYYKNKYLDFGNLKAQIPIVYTVQTVSLKI